MIRAQVADSWSGPWLEIDCRAAQPFPELDQVAGLIPTGSSASVTERADWILATEDYLRRAIGAGTPIFGICFGHQLLGQALGGQVIQNPRGRQIGTLRAERVADDPLLPPGTGAYGVNATHRDIVSELPKGARVLATTPRDPYAFVRFAELAWGVQYHPEFDAVTMRAYIESRRDILAEEGFDPDALLAAVDDAPDGTASLVRFVDRVRTLDR